MAREEVSKRGGFIAQLAVLAIMVILLGVVALVIVNAAAALRVGGVVSDLRAATQLAEASIDSGEAQQKLDQLVRATN